MSDSFLRYSHNLEDIIPVKVEFVEAGLASGLPRAQIVTATARPPLWVSVTIPKGQPLLPRSRQGIRLREGTHYDATTRFVMAANSLLC